MAHGLRGGRETGRRWARSGSTWRRSAGSTFRPLTPIPASIHRFRPKTISETFWSEKKEKLEATPSRISKADVKWLRPDSYRQWRNVGLGSFTRDGLPLDSWKGMAEDRDVAFAGEPSAIPASATQCDQSREPSAAAAKGAGTDSLRLIVA